MTATRETIEKDEPRLVTPEPENQTEAPILEAIEQHYCELDHTIGFTLVSTWVGWQAGNDIGKDDLYYDLGRIIADAQAMRAQIAKLKERRIREPDDVLLAQSAGAIRAITDEMNEGYDCRDLPRQIERIEEKLQSLRVVFELAD